MPTDESKINGGRGHQKRVALRAIGECIEALRVLNAIADPAKNNDKLDRAHDASIKLGEVIAEEI